jgi:hypothetical protein
MPRNENTPFESIEEAQEYLLLLADAVLESKQDVESDITGLSVNDLQARRAEAMRVVAYKLERLSAHLKSSLLLLNDLRTLRRLLLNERLHDAPKKNSAGVSVEETAGEFSYGA